MLQPSAFRPASAIARFAQRALVALPVAAVAFVAALPAPTEAARPRVAEDLYIVDCLLPGQVRRLGQQASFMSARRPVRTTQADCEIRGGEFVAYDRADYRTALKVWLAQAEQGDAAAQNYVGEIYAKGLGTAPDHAKAAGWFEKSVAQGNRRAMINLGYLYEEGMGVPRDLARALNLYRQSAGIEDELLYASTVTAQAQAAQAEIAGLRQTVEEQRAEAERLREDNRRLRGELDQRRGALERSQRELDDARRALVAKQEELAAGGDAAELRALSEDLDRREAALAADRAALERDRAEMAARNDADRVRLAELRAEEEALASRIGAATGDTSGLQADLARVRGAAAELALALDAAYGKMTELETRLRDTDAQQAAAQARFDAERARMQEQLAASQQDRDLLILLEQQLADKRREVSRQREQIAALERQAGLAPTQRVALAAVAAAPGPLVEIINPPLSVTRGRPAAMVRTAPGTSQITGRVSAQAGLRELSVNGKPVNPTSGGLFTVDVPVAEAGAAVSVAAVDAAGARTTLEFELLPLAAGRSQASVAPSGNRARPTPPGLRSGRQLAIVIGNDTYTGYTALSTARADARAVADVLKRRYGFETRLVLDGSRYDILSALNDARESLSDKDSLLVYFAGHGELDAGTREGYWVPVDGRKQAPSTWISNRAISDILNTMSARQVMVVADSCYSGAMTRASVPAFNAAMTDSQWREWVKSVSSTRSRMALTSGGLAPVPDVGADGNSRFARAFIDALEDNNQLMEGQRLFREITTTLALAASETNLIQVPEYAPIRFAGHEAGEFLLLPKG